MSFWVWPVFSFNKITKNISFFCACFKNRRLLCFYSFSEFWDAFNLLMHLLVLATHLLKNPSAPFTLSLPVLRNAFDWLFSLLAIKLSVETTSTLFYCRGNRRVGKLIHLSISKIWILWIWVIQAVRDWPGARVVCLWGGGTKQFFGGCSLQATNCSIFFALIFGEDQKTSSSKCGSFFRQF